MNEKLLIFIAMLALAMTLFAETLDCQSELGRCMYELLDDSFTKECFCLDGIGTSEMETPSENGTFDFTLPTKEECLAEIENICKNAGTKCKNESGSCSVKRNGDYECYCDYVDGKKTGNGYFGQEGCTAVLEKECGTGLPTPRKVCQEKILNECVSYFKRIKNNCSKEPVNIEEILDTPIDASDYSTESAVTAHEFADCCRSEYWRNEYKRESDCIETFDSCEDHECCECTIQVGGDAANTEAPTDGAAKEDTADGDSATPATDSEAPAENKEESKSDGCSMLFI